MGIFKKYFESVKKALERERQIAEVREKLTGGVSSYFKTSSNKSSHDEIMNSYGKSLEFNTGVVVFKNSSLANTKEEIEDALKNFAKESIKNHSLNDSIINILSGSYGNLALFVEDEIAERRNKSFKETNEKNNNDTDETKDILNEIMRYNSDKLTRMVYFEKYIKELKINTK
jgi:capsule polysaccharide modification protein KpsS